jgi:hypothetical protein
MIADVYCVINGIIMMACIAILPVSCLIALDKPDVMPSMMSRMGLEHAIDRRITNMMESDVIRWKSYRNKTSPVTEVVDGRCGLYRTKSTDDVKMMSHPRMNDRYKL